MKSSRFAAGLVGLAITGLWYFAGGTNPLPTSRAAEAPTRVTAPLTHENLTVYFIHGPDAVADVKVMSLQEALDRDLAVVHETSNVNVLAIENRSSEYELFVQSGDIVKGGKQDRMVQSDMLLPPKSGVVPMPAHCVEQGRWTGRGTEDSKKFASAAKCAAGKELKYANYAGRQDAVWANVKQNQDKLNENLKANVNAEASPTSFQLTLEQSALVAKIAEYEAALKATVEDREGVIGVVFAVNGHITGAEVYGSNALFRKAWPKLLNAAAVEAVADRTDAPIASAPSAREIERFLAYGATAEPAGTTDTATASNDDVAVVLRSLQRSSQGYAVNANEEVFQTEGRQVYQTEGRAGQTRGSGTQLSVQTEALNRDRNGVASITRTVTAAPILLPEPAPNPPGRVNDVAGTPVLQQAGGQASGVNRPAVNPPTPAVDNVIMGGSGAGRVATPQPPAPPVNDANRLNSNRTENRSTLMVESRDAGRANAVIHRSYLKK